MAKTSMKVKQQRPANHLPENTHVAKFVVVHILF